jgi:hypothetical protein
LEAYVLAQTTAEEGRCYRHSQLLLSHCPVVRSVISLPFGLADTKQSGDTIGVLKAKLVCEVPHTAAVQSSESRQIDHDLAIVCEDLHHMASPSAMSAIQGGVDAGSSAKDTLISAVELLKPLVNILDEFSNVRQ